MPAASSRLARPQEIYDNPANLFVADFVGKTNRIKATCRGRWIDAAPVERHGSVSGIRPETAALRPWLLRPEAIALSRHANNEGSALAGTVTHRIFLGSSAEYQISVDGLGDFLVTADRRSVQESDLVEPGERVVLTFDPGKVHVFPA